MNKNTDRKPELLAPAGNLLAGLTALDAGADAVYAGLAKFNARERTENFSFEDMSKLIAYAHRNGKKVYVTVNTLIKESELPEIAEYLAELNSLRPDALIVQDLGVLRMIREYFPDMEIHASTQMGFHNSPGLKLAENLGASRVILERQITMSELKTMTKNSPVELEVFVHGALCCSLSGQCLFSSWMGGWSGNRGKCKQPCRRRFFTKNGNGFFFSTQDLCTLEMIPAMKAAGIASLKIEGRLRKPDYVKNAVAAYRMILDCDGEPDKKLLGEARSVLSGTYGRKWSYGFYSLESTRNLIKFNTAGAAGALCGMVSELAPNGFAFTTKRRLHIGDRVRIQPTSGDEGPSVTITKLSVNRRPVKKVSPGQECFIFCDKEIPPRGMIYKIGESYEELSGKINTLTSSRTALDIDIKIADNKFVANVKNASLSPWEAVVNLQPAEKHPLSPEKVAAEFAASCSDDFQCGAVKAEIDGKYFLPASELKEIRRAFWDMVKEKISPDTVFSPGASALEKFRRDYMAIKPAGDVDTLHPETIHVSPNSQRPANRKAYTACSIFDFNKTTDEVVIPSFCPESRLHSLEKLLKEAYQRGIRRFRVTGLYAVEMLKEFKDIEILGSFPLPVSNSMAVTELASLGFSQIQGWIELDKEQLEALAAKSPLPVEIYRYGRPALLVTRAEVPQKGKIKDARNNVFSIEKDRRTDMTSVYAKEVFSIPKLPGTLNFYDLTNANWNEKETSEFNFKLGWM
jgi:putative protease